MNKTLNVNVGSIPFNMNEDAYYLLNGYYEDIRSRLNPAEANDIMYDIEFSTAEIFNENLPFQGAIVTSEMVKVVIDRLGSASDFGKKETSFEQNVNPIGNKRLLRSRKYNMIGGVCGGIAEYFNIDVTLVRILAIILTIFGGVTVFVYVIMWIVIPLAPAPVQGKIRNQHNEWRDRS